MTRKLRKAFKTWMVLEEHGRGDQAEEALRRVFLSLPELPLPAGFVDRILLRGGLARAASTIPSPAQRLLIAVCLLLAGVSVTLLPGFLTIAADLLPAISWIGVGMAALIGLAERLGESLAVWRTLSDVGEIVATALESQMVIAVLTSSALLSAGALRLLYSLMIQERSSGYAGTV